MEAKLVLRMFQLLANAVKEEGNVTETTEEMEVTTCIVAMITLTRDMVSPILLRNQL